MATVLTYLLNFVEVLCCLLLLGAVLLQRSKDHGLGGLAFGSGVGRVAVRRPRDGNVLTRTTVWLGRHFPGHHDTAGAARFEPIAATLRWSTRCGPRARCRRCRRAACLARRHQPPGRGAGPLLRRRVEVPPSSGQALPAPVPAEKVDAASRALCLAGRARERP